ncbi:hypothetical protein OCK74_26970 [Chitinophagaceae bacterium LB-8]|uniref:Porin n=1 Tax=Paraflavisolibacter caeni TaxID=2982496 RepID=A0A9X2Y145_9BACT|nr:hypothetical protein [Paraflavisolibacter caeni]MCU7552790.1 hypothetical protein [Paraflavisolibacter caeni]
MKYAKIGLLVLLSALSSIVVSAQGSPDYGSGLKLNLNNEGSKFVRFIFWNQIWVKSVKNNPGTLVGGESADHSLDIGARRIRTIIHAQISPRYLIMAHFGVNNQTFINGGAPGTVGTGANGAGKKPQIFFHDVYNEYAIIPSKNPVTGKVNKGSLYAGAGLHYWNGISRMTAASTLNFLMIDAPIFNWPTLEVSDQLIRQYGVYVKGNVNKFHYSFNVNKPFATSMTPVAGGPAVDNNGNSKAAIGGYVDYQFLDQEAQVLPFRVGTYLGTKKVLNIGAGFFNNKEGTQSMTLTKVIKKHDINIYALDLFADLPFGPKEKNMALTAYSVLYNYNYGPNYLRTTGIMNTGTVDTAFKGLKAQEGPGNARFLLGTGNIWYTQAGLLLPKTISKKLRIQPVASYSLKNLEALNEVGHYYDFGSNFFIDGHNSKITVQYSSRPLYNNNKVFKRAGEWQMQFQVYL